MLVSVDTDDVVHTARSVYTVSTRSFSTMSLTIVKSCKYWVKLLKNCDTRFPNASGYSRPHNEGSEVVGAEMLAKVLSKPEMVNVCIFV